MGDILRHKLGEGNGESTLPRDSGESILAARHLDVSQDPLGGCLGVPSKFFFFLQALYLIQSGNHPNILEKIARFPGGAKFAKSCHVSGCHEAKKPFK